MNSIDKARGDEPDAWLAQALRHAPDGQADAPPALSDAILREARAAARPRATPPSFDAPGPLQWIRAAWDWLARPPVAASFASLMVVTVLGFMWRDQAQDQSGPRSPEAVSSTPQPRVEGAPPTQTDAVPAPSETQAPPAEPAAARTAPANRESTDPGRRAGKKLAEEGARALPPTDAPTRPRRAAEASEAAPALAAAAPPPVAPPAAPQAQQRGQVAPATQAAAQASAQADSVARSRNNVRPLQDSAASALAKARTADAGEGPLATLRVRIAQRPERWQWQRGQGLAQPMNAAVQGWLAELDRQAASGWQTSSSSAANSVRLFQEGALQATLGLNAGAAWIELPGEASSVVLRAALPEGAANSLRKALDEATL